MKNKKQSEKYKPEHWIYIAIILLSLVIRLVPLSCGSPDLDEAINDLAVGAIASTTVAWLIDVAGCRKKNYELKEKGRMVFAEYCAAINDLCFCVANRCRNFSLPTDKLSLDEWLSLLSENMDNSSNTSPAKTISRTYFHISSYVRSVKNAVLVLKQQYCTLVETDIIDTDDFRQHAVLQVRLCDEICDTIEICLQEKKGIAQEVNTNLVMLVENARIFHPEVIPNKFSWNAKG